MFADLDNYDSSQLLMYSVHGIFLFCLHSYINQNYSVMRLLYLMLLAHSLLQFVNTSTKYLYNDKLYIKYTNRLKAPPYTKISSNYFHSVADTCGRERTD